jgi:diguanylate cyclase (GGDEF)-like protein/putative nucleotidyltransferase with HDIG domain
MADKALEAMKLDRQPSWAALSELSQDAAATSTVQRRAIAWLFTAGPTLALLSIVLPHSPATNEAGIVVLVLGAYLVVAATYIAGERLSPTALSLFIAYGTVLITGAIYFQGNGTGSYAFFYLWVSMYAFYFRPLREAFAHVAFIACAYALLLALATPASPIERWLIAIGTLMVAGFLVRTSREHVHQLMIRLEEAVRTDPLTGLVNRRGFEEHMHRELARARRSGSELAILLGDVDHFKEVNDRLGHHAGDDALQRLGMLLREAGRDGDVVARMGGEEFALILPETGEHGARIVADRVRASVRTEFAAAPVPLTISFGIAGFPGHGDTSEMLLRTADQALYTAKELGRDRSATHSGEVLSILKELKCRPVAEHGAHMTTVLTLAEALDIRNTGTARHTQAVARYAELMAQALGLSPANVERVRLAGILHDVGKVGLPDSILRKPGPLSAEEWTEIEKHPEIGARLLSGAAFTDIRSWVLAHHERPDGTGYPHGRSGEQIPVEARILAVADAYEAMTADRPYRSALSEHDARAELRWGAGAQFDELVVSTFIGLLDETASGGSVVLADAY